MSVSFTLEKRTNTYGECPIRLSWSYWGERYQTTLGFSIRKVDWDENAKLVKAYALNSKGQYAEEINFILKRIKAVVISVEKECFIGDFNVGKDMMKQAVTDALSKNIASVENIVERCVKGIRSVPEPTKRYYRNPRGEYYKFICEAKRYGITYEEIFYIVQELFGEHKIVAVARDSFICRKRKGCMYPYADFTEVSEEKVFGKESEEK